MKSFDSIDVGEFVNISVSDEYANARVISKTQDGIVVRPLLPTEKIRELPLNEHKSIRDFGIARDRRST